MIFGRTKYWKIQNTFYVKPNGALVKIEPVEIETRVSY